MENFVYTIPTTIYFGKGQAEHIGTIVKKYGSRALLVYGGGSIKKNGIYDTVTSRLREEGIPFEELSGVEPNPRIQTVRKGVEICREKKVDVVLPIGGGSTIDCAKAVAAGARYQGDPWDLVEDRTRIKEALPVIAVLTLSATGSEMDTFAVISDMEKREKLGTGSECMRPAASILDPSYTETVNAFQTASGTADMMSHIFEAYFSREKGYMQDRMAEGLLKTCIEFGVKAVKEPEDYEARANLMWAGSWAINNFLRLGKDVDWSVHPMEHELSAFYDITHGAGLAILTPHWMEYVLSEATVDKFFEYAVNVWGVRPETDKWEGARTAIQKTAEYFKEMGLPSTLREVGIDETHLEEMARKAASHMGETYVKLTAEDIVKIFRAAL